MTGTREGRWVPVSWGEGLDPSGTGSIALLPMGPWGLPRTGWLSAPLQDTGDAVLRPPRGSQADLGGRASSSLTPCSSPLSSVKVWRSESPAGQSVLKWEWG